jgi:hypothetical protein
VIDRAKPRIPGDFLASPFVQLPPDIFRRYSLESWLDEVLGLEQGPKT